MGVVRRAWSQQEQFAVFRLYCTTPFGRLHARNPEIKMLAAAMGRTPSAVAMKACNFASLDPIQRERGIVGLGNASASDAALWQSFNTEAQAVALAAEEAYAAVSNATEQHDDKSMPVSATEMWADEDTLARAAEYAEQTEADAFVRVRRTQAFFRATVLVAYEQRCAITGLDVPGLLTASHIVPWRDDTQRRADPRNGICLNALHDRAFDRGFITLDSDHRVVLSSLLKEVRGAEGLLKSYEGVMARMPVRFGIEEAALEYHRERVFRG